MTTESIEKIYNEVKKMEKDLDYGENSLLKHYYDPLDYACYATGVFDRTQKAIRAICFEQRATFAEEPKYGVVAIDHYLTKMRHALEAYKAQEAES